MLLIERTRPHTLSFSCHVWCRITWPLSTQATLLRGRPREFRFQAAGGRVTIVPSWPVLHPASPPMFVLRFHPTSRMKNRLDFWRKRSWTFLLSPVCKTMALLTSYLLGLGSDRDVPKQRAKPGNRKHLGAKFG